MDEYVQETISITSEIPTSERVAFEKVGMIVSERVEMVLYTTSMTIYENQNMLCQHAPCMKDHDTIIFL